jgi:protein associated with RNAse G/E
MGSNINKGENYIIHAYKHDGNVHRSWDEAVFLDEIGEFLVFANNQALVTESDGRVWETKEPAVLFFSKHNWFNIIAQLKKKGITFYCNIASPFVIENKVIKYIDYDLDLRVYSNNFYKVLDRGEYKYHKDLMNYSDDLDFILKKELEDLISMAKEKKFPFDKNMVFEYYEEYKSLNS